MPGIVISMTIMKSRPDTWGLEVGMIMRTIAIIVVVLILLIDMFFEIFSEVLFKFCRRLERIWDGKQL